MSLLDVKCIIRVSTRVRIKAIYVGETPELGPIRLSTVRIDRNETGSKSPFVINKSYLSFARTSFTLEIGTQVLLSTLYSPFLRSDGGRYNSY